MALPVLQNSVGLEKINGKADDLVELCKKCLDFCTLREVLQSENRTLTDL
jgi:hypothetical protein